MAFLPSIQEDLVLQQPLALLDAFEDGFGGVFGIGISEESPHFLKFFGEFGGLKFFPLFVFEGIEDGVEIEKEELGMVGLDFCLFVQDQDFEIEF